MNIKPCPFCGNKEVKLNCFERNNSFHAYVMCPSCGATGGEYSKSKADETEIESRVKDEAAEAWNRRTEKGETV